MLDETQQKTLQTLLNNDTKAALIASLTGSGKTLLSVALAHEINAKTVLVVAPGDTFRNPLDGWQSEVEKYHHPNPPPNQQIIDSSKRGQQAFQALKEGVPGFYYVTHTYLTLSGTAGSHPPKTKKNPTSKPIVFREQKLKWNQINPNLDMVIADEIHHKANRKGSGQRALNQLKPRLYKVAMSATPGGDHFEGLWTVTRWLWPDHIDRSFWRWASQWGTTKYNPFGSSSRSMIVTGEKEPGAFTKSLPCYVRDQPPNIKVPVDPWFVVETPMTEPQQKQYDQMLKHSIAWLKDNPLVAELPVSQKVRLRQMCLGEVAFNEDGEVDFPLDTNSTKIDKAIIIAQKRHPNDKILMFVGDSQKFAEVVAQRLQQNGIAAKAWTGKTSKAQRKKIKDAFVRGDLRVIVASITAISDGVDGLQLVSSIEIWFNKSLYGIKNEQAEGRLNRRGQTQNHITRYELITPDTADEETFSLDAKKFITRMKELN